MYYFQHTGAKKKLIKIDLSTGEKKEVLDFDDLVAALAANMDEKIDLEKLPFDRFSMQEKPLQLCFSYNKINWYYDFESKACIKKSEDKLEELKSPDERWTLIVKNHNLCLLDLKSGSEYQITSDGEKYYDYASSPETNTQAVSLRLAGRVLPPVALWSPDSTKIVTHKLNQRNVRELALLQYAPEDKQRPEVHTYRMSFTGDEHLPLAELMVIDAATKNILPLKIESFLSPYLTLIEFKWVWWGEDSKKIYFLRESRGSKELSLYVADVETGATKILITESSDTYVEPNQHFASPHQVVILENRKEFIWLSERSGYPHLYLYEMSSDVPKNAITQGEWFIRDVHFYDDKNDWLYFTACGLDKNSDPYYKYFYRCHLDGTDLTCLTKENANHTISISPDKNSFLDTYSTINTQPVTQLKRMDGTLICAVEAANINGLEKLNWVPPQRFCKKGRDGKTDIYGNIYFPSNFDSNKKYPVIDHVYPGPQFYRTPTHFNLFGSIFRSAWLGQALAELGFIVVHIDGFGTPGRSKAFHDATYKNMSDCGIPDHVVVIKQLASKHKFIDIERIGITGYSGGGYATVRAMLAYPDFYKVGVAAAGNHDLRCYPASYGEKYNSLDVDTYESQSNTSIAQNLDGKLLLIHGELDDNVHPCATFQLVDALIRHNKDFDMLIMPNQNHDSTFDHPYYIRKLWDYFVQHLLGQIPPKNYLIKPMPVDFPQMADW